MGLVKLAVHNEKTLVERYHVLIDIVTVSLGHRHHKVERVALGRGLYLVFKRLKGKIHARHKLQRMLLRGFLNDIPVARFVGHIEFVHHLNILVLFHHLIDLYCKFT